MSNITSAHINAEIYTLGPALFESVRSAVIESGTVAPTRASHEANQSKLKATVAQVLEEAIPRELDHRELWQVLWQRVVYAGTRSAKANAEIKSMRDLVPLFQDLDRYVEGRFVFDEDEWNAFADQWKGRLGNKGQKTRWIELSKTASDWNPSAYFAGKKTTPEIWKVLTKDSAEYPDLRFSTHSSKVAKYVKLARFLHQHRAAGHQRPLDYYLDGSVFNDEHITGQQWLDERRILDKVRARLSAQVGELTALHTMMDLGLKTIKPDRVMTYLFSQLGWLQSLPSTMPKDEVLDVYTKDIVVEEMTVRADVFAAALHNAGYSQAHRLLDIWLVKFGQEPEEMFGITVNLQAKDGGIQAILDRLTDTTACVRLAADDAARMWPTREFVAVPRTTKAVGRKWAKAEKKPKLSEEEVDRLAMEQWRLGRKTHPNIYPARIDNRPKEAIWRLIERHVDPEEAFLSVLLLD